MDKSKFMDPDDMADIYWSIHCQKKSAWVQELDVRNFQEKW